MSDNKIGIRYRLQNYYNLLSHRLLICYSKKRIKIGIDFICCKCFGVLIHPFNCNFCNASFCKKCCESKNSYICQICNNDIQENVLIPFLSILQNSTFTVENENIVNKAYLENQKCEIPYDQIIKNSDQFIIPYLTKAFTGLTSANFELLNKSVKNYSLKECKDKNSKIEGVSEYIFKIYGMTEKGKYIILDKIIDHSFHCNNKINRKVTNLIYFIKCCKFKLKLKRKILCKNDIKKIHQIYLRKLVLDSCLFSADFAVAMAQLLLKNRSILTSLEMIIFQFQNEKWLYPIYRAISLLKKLKLLSISASPEKTDRWNCNEEIFTRIFQSNLNISILELKSTAFGPSFNSDSNHFLFFNNKENLLELDLSYCYFEISYFLSFTNKFKQIKKLTLMEIEIYESSPEFTDQFLPILIENVNPLFFKVAFSNPHMILRKVFMIYLLKNKSITRLSLTYCGSMLIQEAADFCYYITHPETILTHIRFFVKQNDYLEKFLHSFSKNKSLKNINLKNIDLGNSSINYKHIINLINSNSFITSLNCSHCKIFSGSLFPSAILHNANLQIVDLSFNNLPNNVIEKLNKIQNKIIILKGNGDKI